MIKTITIKKISFILSILTPLLIISYAYSNPGINTKVGAVDEAEVLPVEINSSVRYLPARSAKSLPGKVSVTEAFSECAYEFKAFEKLPVKFSFESEYFGIKNSTEVELPAHLTGLSFGMEATLPFLKFDKTYFRFGAKPGFYSDDWNINSSSFRLPAYSFLIYELDKKLTFIAGLALYPDFERKALPIIGFIYKPNDKLTFNFTPRNPNINYLLNDKTSLFAEYGSSINAEFEVTKDNLKNVVLKYNETKIGAGVKYGFNKYIQASFSAGGVFNRYLKYRDSLGKVSLKNGLYTEFKVDIRI